jgi:hypothetical protein
MQTNLSLNSPVLVIGGSYLGSLAAWLRLKYPALTSAAWVVNAPIQIDDNFTNYYVNAIGTSCLSNLSSFIVNVDPAFYNTLGFESNQSTVSVKYAIASVVANLAQIEDPISTDLCDSAKNRDLKAFNASFHQGLASLGTNQKELDPLFVNRSDTDDLSWSWLVCNELGWFELSNDFGGVINVSYFDRVCRERFGREHIGADRAIRRFGRDFRGTNIYFLNSSTNSWTNLSVKSSNPSYDQRVSESDTAKLNDFSDDSLVMDDLRNWMNGAIIDCGENGHRVWNSCSCNAGGWGGAKCEQFGHPEKNFKIIAVCAVTITSLLLLIIGASVWWCGKREDDDMIARGSYQQYT